MPMFQLTPETWSPWGLSSLNRGHRNHKHRARIGRLFFFLFKKHQLCTSKDNFLQHFCLNGVRFSFRLHRWTKGIGKTPSSMPLLSLDNRLDKLRLEPFLLSFTQLAAAETNHAVERCKAQELQACHCWFYSSLHAQIEMAAHALTAWTIKIPIWVSQHRATWASVSMQLMSDLALTGHTVIQRAWLF